MKAKELLSIITSKGYSKSTMQRIFNMARNEIEADKVAKLIKDSKTEEELLEWKEVKHELANLLLGVEAENAVRIL